MQKNVPKMFTFIKNIYTNTNMNNVILIEVKWERWLISNLCGKNWNSV